MFADTVQHHQAGRIDEAVARYKRALMLKPYYAEAHNNLGVALVALGRMDGAVAHYERALILKPDYADAHMGSRRAHRLYTMGELAKAANC
jgi:Flp pilus assembly protein TadD